MVAPRSITERGIECEMHRLIHQFLENTARCPRQRRAQCAKLGSARWFEIAQDPPPGYSEIAGGAGLGTPWLAEGTGHVKAIGEHIPVYIVSDDTRILQRGGSKSTNEMFLFGSGGAPWETTTGLLLMDMCVKGHRDGLGRRNRQDHAFRRARRAVRF